MQSLVLAANLLAQTTFTSVIAEDLGLLSTSHVDYQLSDCFVKQLETPPQAFHLASSLPWLTSQAACLVDRLQVASFKKPSRTVAVVFVSILQCSHLNPALLLVQRLLLPWIWTLDPHGDILSI